MQKKFGVFMMQSTLHELKKINTVITSSLGGLFKAQSLLVEFLCNEQLNIDYENVIGVNKTMPSTHIPFAASFWLGKIHTSMLAILDSDESTNLKLQKVEELEIQLREAIEKLYHNKSC